MNQLEEEVKSLISLYGKKHVENNIDQSIIDIIQSSDMDQALKDQLLILFGLKRCISVFSKFND